MNKRFFILLFLAIAAYGQQERIAIIQTVDDRDSIGISELAHLTDKLRETAVNVLPKQRYGVMTTESIVAFLGSQERAAKECREASCLADLGRKVNADYVAQARIGRFGENLTVKTELYSVKSGNLLGSFTGNSKDIFDLLALIDEKAPILFKKMPGASGSVSDLEEAVDYELDSKDYTIPYKPPTLDKPPVKTSFWVALALDVLGAAFIGYAIYENNEMNKAYEEYSKSGQSQDHYDNARENVENSRSARNTFYVIGGSALALGIGVHIWF
jgi:TolB-like protein